VERQLDERSSDAPAGKSEQGRTGQGRGPLRRRKALLGPGTPDHLPLQARFCRAWSASLPAQPGSRVWLYSGSSVGGPGSRYVSPLMDAFCAWPRRMRIIFISPARALGSAGSFPSRARGDFRHCPCRRGFAARLLERRAQYATRRGWRPNWRIAPC